MPTNESSFGARLKNSNDMVSYVEGFNGYNPPREEEKSEQLKQLNSSIEKLNADVAVNTSLFRTAVKERQSLFKNGPGSVELLLSPILKAVLAQYGKKSAEYTQVSAIVKKFRSVRIIKTAVEGEKAETEEHISRSQRSFGSNAQLFRDLVSTLSQCNGYSVSNSLISLDSLNALSVKLNEANNKVASALGKLTESRKQRDSAYKDLAERTRRVKSYVLSQYGTGSKEYMIISKLKI